MSITTPPTNFRRLFLDMNAFFASVEQQVQPTLRGKPVGITPYIGASGCVIARSYEAKEWGVGTGDRVGDALAKCPKINIVESHPALYTHYHKEILKVLKNHSPWVQVLSIDEFVINLTGSDQSRTKATLMACSIKKGIREKVGDFLKCSVGIGPSTFLAKVACESKKPDGFTIVEVEHLDAFYNQLKLLDIPGINLRMEARFNRLNIKTPLELYKLPLPYWIQVFGHMGRAWYYRLRGYEVDVKPSDVKSIGHSHVLSPEFRSRSGAQSVLKKLIQKTGRRLRAKNLVAAGVFVSISFYDHGYFQQSKKTADFNDDQTLGQYVFAMIKDLKFDKKPLRLAVTVFNLKQALGYQLSIFPEMEKKRLLSHTVDNINDRFGAKTIAPASVGNAKDSAPDRIPFGAPRYDILNF
jgi:DNA polymerase-4